MAGALLMLLIVGWSVGAEPVARVDPFESAMIAAIHQFAEQGDVEHLKAVLDKYPQLVNARRTVTAAHKPLRTDGFTALHYAADQGRDAAVAVLLEKKANVNSDDGSGWTPLHLAARRGELSIVKALVEAGADTRLKTDASAGGLRVLPGAPAGSEAVQIPAVPARTALDLAREAKHESVVKYLESPKK